MSYIRWGEGTPHYLYQTDPGQFTCLHCDDTEFKLIGYRQALHHLWSKWPGIGGVGAILRASWYLVRDCKRGE